MMKKTKRILTLLCFIGCCLCSTNMLQAQQADHLLRIRERLGNLAIELPGLNQKIEMDVTGAGIADFMRGLAQSYQLNINISPDVQQKMTNHFSNVTVMDVLYFLAQQYGLDYDFTGYIINVRNYRDPKLDMPPQPKEITIGYNPQTRFITLDLRADTLINVARKISQLSGVNVTVMPNAMNKPVTGFVKDQTVSNALQQIALSNRLKFSRVDDYSFILESLNDDEEFVTKRTDFSNNNYTIARKTSGDNKSGPGRAYVDVQSAGNEKIVNINAVNTPLKELVKSISEQAGVPYFIYADVAGNITAEAKGLTYTEVLKKILTGTPYSFVNENGVYMIGEKKLEGIRNQRLIQLKHRSVDSLSHFLPDDLKMDVVIKEFKELNAFLVTGSEPQLDKIESLVQQLDRKVPMVMIEVIIMDINKGRTTKAGIKAGIMPDSTIKSSGSLFGGLDMTLSSGTVNRLIDKIGLNNVFNIGKVTPSFYLQLQAIESQTNADVRQTPKLSTLNGHPATLSIGSTRYYSISTQNTLGSLNPAVITTQQYTAVEANLALSITPFVAQDEDVTLNLEMNITNFTGDTPLNQPPPTATSKFKSIIRVKNDDMILLGGIERTEKSESGSGTPFLSRIPVLKWLFSTRSRTNGKVVSIVFIRPTIVYN